MPTEPIERDGISWIEIGLAAKRSRTKAVAIREDIEAGRIACRVEDGKTFIPLGAANRLKREAGLMTQVANANKKRVLPPANRPGVLTKEKQEVLPMTSGRKGRGWIG